MSRLEEIKERYEKNKLQTLPLTNEQCKWLINRVEELEKQIIEMTDYMEMLERLNKRAERYKQALETIAKHETLGIDIRTWDPVRTDAGEIARKALEEMK